MGSVENEYKTMLIELHEWNRGTISRITRNYCKGIQKDVISNELHPVNRRQFFSKGRAMCLNDAGIGCRSKIITWQRISLLPNRWCYTPWKQDYYYFLLNISLFPFFVFPVTSIFPVICLFNFRYFVYVFLHYFLCSCPFFLSLSLSHIFSL